MASSRLGGIVALGLFALLQASRPGSAAESVCARVKIRIPQKLTLERQAFDANMIIHNPLDIPLTDVGIDVLFTDDAGNSVIASSDPDDTTASFFIRIASTANIAAVDGSGTVPATESADIHWLIIPAPGAAGPYAQGTTYFVGATLRYSLAGQQEVANVSPDYINVKPMPTLLLDYFLPRDVYGDDAFTPVLEPPVPFSMGVRVKNSGYGPAYAVAIESAQPRITEDVQGLNVGFEITGSQVNGLPAAESLRVHFGDIGPSASSVARWIMECTLSGSFVDFTARYTHADELGGQLTSLIGAVDTHLLVHDVLLDLPGQDAILDFLADDGDYLRVYTSDGTNALVADKSSGSTLMWEESSGTQSTYQVTVPQTAGLLYVSTPFPNSDALYIVSAIRFDGKRLHEQNAWFSKTRETGGAPWEHALNLFDVDGGGTYEIVIADIVGEPLPPVLDPIGRKVVFIGEPSGLVFNVSASDPNGTLPELTAAALPPEATFSTTNSGSVTQGAFAWWPTAEDHGVHDVLFRASDGALSDEEWVKVYVAQAGEPTNALGVPIPTALSAFSIALSDDYRSTVLTWGEVSAQLLKSTNQYYHVGSSGWYTAAMDVSSLWVDNVAGDAPAAYYRLVSGVTTSAFAVGKYDVDLQGGNGWAAHDNDLSCPFIPFDTSLNSVFGGRLTPDAGTDRDIVFQGDGGVWAARYNDDGDWESAGGQQATNLAPNSRILVRRGRTHTNTTSVTFFGKVPPNPNLTVSIQRGDGVSSYDNWQGWPYPAPLSFDASGVTNVLTPDSGFERDIIFQMNGAKYARYGSGGTWTTSGGAEATNFYPGRGYIWRIDETHQAGPTNIQLRLSEE